MPAMHIQTATQLRTKAARAAVGQSQRGVAAAVLATADLSLGGSMAETATAVVVGDGSLDLSCTSTSPQSCMEQEASACLESAPLPPPSSDSSSSSSSSSSNVVEIVRTMMAQEEAVYAYGRYRPDDCSTVGIRDSWRQDICHWVSSKRSTPIIAHMELEMLHCCTVWLS